MQHAAPAALLPQWQILLLHKICFLSLQLAPLFQLSLQAPGGIVEHIVVAIAAAVLLLLRIL